MKFSVEMETRNFNKKIRQFARKSSLSTDQILRKFAFDLVARIIQKWPVDSGRSRAAWYIAIENLAPKLKGAGTERVVKGRAIKTPTPGAEAEGRALGSITDRTGAMVAQKFIEIINGVSYSIYLEYGWSAQASMGAVRISMRELTGQKPPAKQLGRDLKSDWNAVFYGRRASI